MKFKSLILIIAVLFCFARVAAPAEVEYQLSYGDAISSMGGTSNGNLGDTSFYSLDIRTDTKNIPIVGPVVQYPFDLLSVDTMVGWHHMVVLAPEEGGGAGFLNILIRLPVIENINLLGQLGVGVTDINDWQGQHNGFNFLVNPGIEYTLKDEFTVLYLLHHISNAGLYQKNGGVNSHVIGFTYRFNLP